ncbi:MAG: SprT family zinc-dependent metalloprotease [Pseudomonadota bacterium]
MTELTLPGAQTIPLTLRRSSRARRITLRVSRLDGRVTLTLPYHVPDSAGLEFAETRAPWIADQLGKIETTVSVVDGTTLPVEGQTRHVVIGREASSANEIGAPSVAALAAGLKERARRNLVQSVDRFTEDLGRPASAITLRDTRSRWGSCSASGRLMFSWRLILAPPKVLDYVAAHEVAHLKHMDHSAAFWGTVAQLYPGYDDQRRWLRQNGPSLHRYQFGH